MIYEDRGNEKEKRKIAFMNEHDTEYFIEHGTKDRDVIQITPAHNGLYMICYYEREK